MDAPVPALPAIVPAPSPFATTSRILVIEGPHREAALVAELLAGAGETVDVLAAARFEDALEALLDAPVDVVVLAAGGDGADVLDLLAQVRAVTLDVPVVVLAGADDDEAALRAVRRGAQDVLAREGLTPRALARSLRFALERERLDGELARRAMHDPLTGLPNRSLLRDRLAQAIGRLGRHEGVVALLVLDLDGFKAVNDAHGHEAGDELLVDVARRLASVLRAGDTAARIGGDEFVVLCEDIAGEHEAVAVAQRIAAALAEPFATGAAATHVHSSVGIALARGAGVRPETLLRDADAAMYRAKQREVPYEVFDDEMRARAARRIDLEAALARACDRGEFTLHYQPVFELRTGAISSCEALLRWAHPERGLLPPAEFLEVAEDSGLLLQIGAWVLRSALRQGSLWREDRPGAPVGVCVNLSPRQCLHHDTVSAMQRALAETGIDPGLVCAEFTEAAVMADPARVGRVLHGLKDLGIRLAIDDFGTANTSLRLLERLPVDVVKIDRSFTSGMSDSHEEAAIVASVIGLAHAFGLVTVAEGVETLAQVDRLRALGCDAAQGHWFARPQAPAELGGLLAALA